MTKAKFIVLEGLDFTGKTTIAKEVTETLNQRNQSWLSVRCPSDLDGTASAGIRKLIMESGLSFTPDVQAMLFGAATIDLIQSTIWPSLTAGTNVLCERFVMSTKVYQSGSHAMSKIVECLEAQIKPDLTIVYDITPEVYLERLSKRGKLNSMDTEDITEINHRRIRYRRQYLNTPNCVMIDATLPLDQVVKATLDSINMVLVGKSKTA